LEKPIEGSLPLEVFQGGRAVGELSSVATAPNGEGTWALGLIQGKALASGETLMLPDGQPVEVVKLAEETK
jgi:hypothetical protein